MHLAKENLAPDALFHQPSFPDYNHDDHEAAACRPRLGIKAAGAGEIAMLLYVSNASGQDCQQKQAIS
jgi:hypothetical protein